MINGKIDKSTTGRIKINVTNDRPMSIDFVKTISQYLTQKKIYFKVFIHKYNVKMVHIHKQVCSFTVILTDVFFFTVIHVQRL